MKMSGFKEASQKSNATSFTFFNDRIGEFQTFSTDHSSDTMILVGTGKMTIKQIKNGFKQATGRDVC